MAYIPAKTYLIPEPYGVSLIIGAWNFPFLTSIARLVGAVAAGNRVILDPSEMVPATSALMSKLINAAFAPDYFKVVFQKQQSCYPINLVKSSLLEMLMLVKLSIKPQVNI